MNICTKSVGFAATASVATVALTSGAFAQGGETPLLCNPILVPGGATGTTVGFLDDTNETCPYAGSTSPDVFYCYTATATQEITIDLCESGYDCQTYVYDSNLALVIRNVDLTPACNDDACSSSGGGGFRSFLDCVNVTAGNSYFIAVDGWQGAAGPYNMVTSVTDPASCVPAGPCEVSCPSGSTIEAEPCKFGNTLPDDTFNGGCNCSDPAGCFGTIVCDTEVVCGTSYFDGAFRDTDWYSLDVSSFAGGVSLEIKVRPSSRPSTAASTTVIRSVRSTAPPSPPSPSSPSPLAAIRSPSSRLRSPVRSALVFVGTDFTETVDCNDPDPIPPGVALTTSCPSTAPRALCPARGTSTATTRSTSPTSSSFSRTGAPARNVRRA